MERQLLEKALGAISSYSLARDGPPVRVVFCDAALCAEGQDLLPGPIRAP